MCMHNSILFSYVFTLWLQQNKSYNRPNNIIFGLKIPCMAGFLQGQVGHISCLGKIVTVKLWTNTEQ